MTAPPVPDVADSRRAETREHAPRAASVPSIAGPPHSEPAEPRIETRERLVTERVIEPRPVTTTKVVREKERVVEERTVLEEGDPRIVLPEPPPARRVAAALTSSTPGRAPAAALSPARPATRRGQAPPLRRANPPGVMPIRDATARGEEPAIRITIGRVDVRAVVKADAPRPARSEPQGPRLSLEDYLRMRDGGSR